MLCTHSETLNCNFRFCVIVKLLRSLTSRIEKDKIYSNNILNNWKRAIEMLTNNIIERQWPRCSTHWLSPTEDRSRRGRVNIVLIGGSFPKLGYHFIHQWDWVVKFEINIKTLKLKIKCFSFCCVCGLIKIVILWIITYEFCM